MHGGRAPRARILHPCRRLETQVGIGLQHQGSGEILRRESRIEMAKHNLIDIGGGDARIGKGLVGDLDHQAFDGLGVEFAKGRMRPTDDAGCHDGPPKG